MSEAAFSCQARLLPVTSRYRGFALFGLFTALPLVVRIPAAGTFLPAFLAVLVAAAAPSPSDSEVRVSVGPEVLKLGRRKLVRASIAGVAWMPDPDGRGLMLLDDSDEPLAQLVFAEERKARELVSQLGFAPPTKTVLSGTSPLTTGPLGSVPVRSLLALFPVVAAIFARILPLLWPVALFGLLVVGYLFSRSRIRLGADGVDLDSLGGHRFVPYEAIESVAAEDTWVELRLSDGKLMRLPVAFRRPNPSPKDTRRVELLADALRRATTSREQDSSRSPTLEDQLARRGRSLSEWQHDLTNLWASPGRYREAEVDEEALWRVLEDPRAEPTARAGAAMLLRGELDERGHTRLRVAREAVAEPRLRVALERADQDDLAAFLAAVDECISEDELEEER